MSNQSTKIQVLTPYCTLNSLNQRNPVAIGFRGWQAEGLDSSTLDYLNISSAQFSTLLGVVPANRVAAFLLFEIKGLFTRNGGESVRLDSF